MLERVIPFLSLKEINVEYQDALLEACKRVIASGWYVQGEELECFERSFASWCGVKNCIGVGNGFDAIKLILKAWIEQGKIKSGDEVVVPGNSFIASALAVSELGLVPKFADVDLDSFNLTLETIAQVCTDRTKVIMPVHLYGNPCPMLDIQLFAKENGYLVLEDCAQAHGAKINDKYVGSFSDAAAFSFYPGKVLGALGDAGAIVTDNEDLVGLIKSLRNYGSSKKYVHEVQGVNSRLDELQAAMLSVKIKFLDQEIDQRKNVASLYSEALSESVVSLPLLTGDRHAWHLYVIRSANRDGLQQHLLKSGIETVIHYPLPIYKQQAYKEYRQVHCSNVDALAKTVLSLPISPVMKRSDIVKIVDVVNSFYCE